MVQTVIQSQGKIDILINDAGITTSGTVIDTPEEVWDKVIGVNLKGIFLCSKYAIPHMINDGGGTVV